MALTHKCIDAGVPEEQLCKWATQKFKVSPVNTIVELLEIAPRRVSQFLAVFDNMVNEIKATK